MDRGVPLRLYVLFQVQVTPKRVGGGAARENGTQNKERNFPLLHEATLEMHTLQGLGMFGPGLKSLQPNPDWGIGTFYGSVSISVRFDGSGFTIRFAGSGSDGSGSTRFAVRFLRFLLNPKP